MLRSTAFSFVLLFAFACDRGEAPEPTPAASAEAPVPEPPAPVEAEPAEVVEGEDGVEDTVAAVEPTAAPGPGKSPALGAGDGCRDSSECGAGKTCVGDGLEGCGGAAGRCEAGVQCTRDARQYCGCDGVTFRASSQCPGREFAYAGECRAGGTKPGATGAACSTGDECESGICEGRGCGPQKPGQCVARGRTCTTDAVVYCGCDNRSFRSSSKCPGRRYRNRGDCHG